MNILDIISDLPVKGLFAGVCLGYAVGIALIYLKSKNSMKCNVEEVKVSDTKKYQVALIINSSLKMGKGKIAAQCGHAVLGLRKKAAKASSEVLDEWIKQGLDITLVTTESAENYDDISYCATAESLPYYIVADAGRTQIKSGSLTVMAIGPAPVEIIKNYVDHYPLYL